MATYAELKELYQNRNQIKDKELIANINIDEFDKVPTEYSIPHDEFVKANSGLKGIMDYDKRGYTEPEDYRLCFQCNQAIARIDEVMPYLDKINESLEKRGVDINSFKDSSSYSTRLLPLGDEILRARDAGVVEEYADYLCSEIAPRDTDAPHWMRETTEARRFLQRGYALDQVKSFMEGNPEVRQSVDLFVRDCEHNQTSTDYMMKGVSVITKCKDMDSAYAISDTMTRAKFSPEAADAIRESYEMMMNAPDDKNPMIPAINERRFEVNHMIGSADRYIGDITSFASEHQSIMDAHPELIKEMTQDFIDNGKSNRSLSSYFHNEPDKTHDFVAPYYMISTEPKTPEPEACGGDGNNYTMFYTGGGSSYANNTMDNIAAFGKGLYPGLKDKSLDEIKDYHIYWGSDEASGYNLKGFYNGDTYVLFDDIEKLPPEMKHDAEQMCDGYRKDRQHAAVDSKYNEDGKYASSLFDKRTKGYYVLDYMNGDGEGGTKIGKIVNGNPEPFAEDDGGIGFHEITHHAYIDNCIDYLKSTYKGDSQENVFKNLECDKSLSHAERNYVTQRCIGNTLGKSNDYSMFNVKGVNYRTSKEGEGFYTGYVDVPDNISKNGKAYITFNKNQIKDDNGAKHTATIRLKNDSNRKIRVLGADGKYADGKVTVGQLKDLNVAVLESRKKAIEIAKATGDGLKTLGDSTRDFGDE